MQKTLCSLLVALAVLMCCPAALAQATVALGWINAPNPWTACSTTVTVACEDHKVVNEVTIAANPAVLSSSIAPSATSFTTSPYVNNAYATRLYTLVLVYRDMNGTLQQDAAATCGSSNTPPPCAVTGIAVTPPAAPTNFGGKAQ